MANTIPQSGTTPIPPVQFGNPLTDWVKQPDSGQTALTADGAIVFTRKWKVQYSGFFSNIPSIGDPDPDGFTGAPGPTGQVNIPRCFHVDVERQAPGVALITAKYMGYNTLPPPVYELVNSRVDRPIDTHPSFFDVAKFPDACKVYDPVPTTPAQTATKVFRQFQNADPTDTTRTGNNRFAGIQSYITGSAQWRRTKYSLTPLCDCSSVGKLEAPDIGSMSGSDIGLPDYSNSNHSWLLIEHTCRNMLMGATQVWIITDSWLYNPAGWRTEIYPSA